MPRLSHRRETPCPPADPIVTGNNPLAPGTSCWRSRGIRDWTIIHTVDGEGWYRLNSKEIRASRGSVVIIPPGVCHDYGVDRHAKEWKLIWAVFDPRPAWTELLNWPAHANDLRKLSLEDSIIRAKVLAKLREMNEMAGSGHRLRDLFAMNALEAALLWCDSANPVADSSRRDLRLRRGIEFLCTNLAKPIRLEDVAHAAGLSVPHIGRMFREQLATTPRQFLEQERMHRAKQLLAHTVMNIGEIAHEVGFEDAFYFSQRFKKLVGVNPRKYRARG